MLLSDYQLYIHQSRYARYRDDLGRRETWDETVKRYCDFLDLQHGKDFPYQDVYDGIYEMHVMPSMRALMTAGEALERDNVAGYNCSYLPIDHPRAFDECMYILLCGTGVGFSVERQFIQSLPEVPESIHKSDTKIVVADSKIGWASAFRELISLLYAGKYPSWDLSRIRPAGARLKVFGGRASGPAPLDELFHFTCALFGRAMGRRLNSVEVHDLVCKIADVVVVGGVRRSALISLSNLTDERMQRAKMGQWWETDPQRALANNSVAYTEMPDMGIFMREWQALYESKSGERGIFNRVAAKRAAEATGRRKADRDFGTNPCGEIILRPYGLCNLSEVVVRADDTVASLREKVRLATIIGTFQSTLTDFRYLRPVWKHNAEEERLLGVSQTGIMDNPALLYNNGNLETMLEELKQHAITTNKTLADGLGIAQSVSITTVKPSGTVSQLVDSASGIHPRYSSYYLRTVRADKKDPLAQFLRTEGVPVEDDVTKPGTTDVFTFPVESPGGSLTRHQVSALDQLEHYKIFKKHWCEHNPSITVYVRENEWLDVGAWVYKNFNEIGGVSFLPFSDHIYKQAPYTEITEKDYDEFCEQMPMINWNQFKEATDFTTASQEMACIGGTCEVNL
jgi:ribonucleoside-triphosphate reductase (thioredoxin)